MCNGNDNVALAVAIDRKTFEHISTNKSLYERQQHACLMVELGNRPHRNHDVFLYFSASRASHSTGRNDHRSGPAYGWSVHHSSICREGH